MSDILKNQAIKGVQGAMSTNPIGGSKKVKWAMHVKEWENDDKGMRTNPKTTNPDKPKRNTKKSKTHTAQPRRGR